jgi:hypothetical protein
MSTLISRRGIRALKKWALVAADYGLQIFLGLFFVDPAEEVEGMEVEVAEEEELPQLKIPKIQRRRQRLVREEGRPVALEQLKEH